MAAATVAVVAAAGVLCALGLLLASYLELTGGFGGPDDASPEMGIVAACATGMVVSLLVPAVLAAWWLRRSRQLVAVGVVVILATGVACLVLGLG